MEFVEAVDATWNFFKQGGFFMLLLGLCSVVGLVAILMKALGLTRARILPKGLAGEVERIDDHLAAGTMGELRSEFAREENSLARLCSVALQNVGKSPGEVTEAVQSSAREEIVRMNAGMPVLDVIITICPLLGLLGTASGLVTAFDDFDDKENIRTGIATALSTTIVGIAITVPAVIAQGIFSRKIELYAARLEVLLGRVVSACHQHMKTSEK
jgi:biopolymer transport protein ExbB